jgi:hypothetical protein
LAVEAVERFHDEQEIVQWIEEAIKGILLKPYFLDTFLASIADRQVCRSIVGETTSFDR